jgi:gamma-glutamylputrescine oxidase
MSDWLRANDCDGGFPGTLYAERHPLPDPRPPLDGDAEADLCVIGGGITGLSAALHGARAGMSVVLLEAQRLGWGASGRNGGQVGTGFNRSLRWLEARLGSRDGRAAWDLSREAGELTRALLAAHAPEADYRAGVLQTWERPSGDPAAEATDLSRRTGARLEVLGASDVAAMIGTARYAGGVLDLDAGWCDPLAYVLGLARACAAAGVRLHESCEALSLAPGEVRTATGTVRARTIVTGTNGYSALTGAKARRVLPINNYVAATAPGVSPMARPVAVADARFVVNYFHPTRDGRLVFGGGESYGRRFPTDIRARVRANLARVYPDLAEVELTHAWGGTLAVTATRLPWLAEPAPGVFSTGGYSGHGLALAGLWGKLAVEAARGERARFALAARLPVPALPGGRVLGPWLAQAGMALGAVRDRL